MGGGYFIARPARRSAYMNAELLPDTIVSATDCLVDLVPNIWSIEWAGDARDREEAGARFSLQGRGLADFTTWCTQAFDSGELGWPGVFLDLDLALRTRERFFSGTEGLVVFGIALPADLVPDFIDENLLAPGEGEPGVVTAIRRGTPPSPGRPLGVDVLGWDHGGFHSYICNGLETEFDAALGIRPNRHGFFDEPGDARRCAEHSNLETTGAEPCLWLPWMVRLYDGTFGE